MSAKSANYRRPSSPHSDDDKKPKPETTASRDFSFDMDLSELEDSFQPQMDYNEYNFPVIEESPILYENSPFSSFSESFSSPQLAYNFPVQYDPQPQYSGYEYPYGQYYQPQQEILYEYPYGQYYPQQQGGLYEYPYRQYYPQQQGGLYEYPSYQIPQGQGAGRKAWYDFPLMQNYPAMQGRVMNSLISCIN